MDIGTSRNAFDPAFNRTASLSSSRWNAGRAAPTGRDLGRAIGTRGQRRGVNPSWLRKHRDRLGSPGVGGPTAWDHFSVRKRTYALLKSRQSMVLRKWG